MKHVRTPGKRISRTAGRLMLGAALCLTLAACGGNDNKSDDAPSTDSTSSTSPDNDASATVEPTPAPEPAGLDLNTVVSQEITAVTGATDSTGSETLAGKLIIADNGCLHLTARNAAPTLLVFPADVSLDTKKKPTMVLDGARYPVGSLITLTGETLNLNAAQRAQTAPCVAPGEVFQIAKIG